MLTVPRLRTRAQNSPNLGKLSGTTHRVLAELLGNVDTLARAARYSPGDMPVHGRGKQEHDRRSHTWADRVNEEEEGV